MELLEKIRDGDIESFEWFYFLALALILAFGTIQTTGTTLGTERPVVSVISCSMYPVYNVGDILIVEGQNYENIEVGDIAIYQVPDKMEFTADGESYTLEENSPMYNTSVETSVGTVKLHKVQSDPRNGNNRALISVDGERYAVFEGQSSGGITVNGVAGQPVPIVHRVINKSDDSLQTKGDANDRQLEFESEVRPFQIYGTTAFKIPRIGAIKLIAMDLVGFNGDAPLALDNTPSCTK